VPDGGRRRFLKRALRELLDGKSRFCFESIDSDDRPGLAAKIFHHEEIGQMSGPNRTNLILWCAQTLTEPVATFEEIHLNRHAMPLIDVGEHARIFGSIIGPRDRLEKPGGAPIDFCDSDQLEVASIQRLAQSLQILKAEIRAEYRTAQSLASHALHFRKLGKSHEELGLIRFAVHDQ